MQSGTPQMQNFRQLLINVSSSILLDNIFLTTKRIVVNPSIDDIESAGDRYDRLNNYYMIGFENRKERFAER